MNHQLLTAKINQFFEIRKFQDGYEWRFVLRSNPSVKYVLALHTPEQNTFNVIQRAGLQMLQDINEAPQDAEPEAKVATPKSRTFHCNNKRCYCQ